MTTPTKRSAKARKAQDLRSPCAKARDAFLGSDEGIRICDPTTLGAPSRRSYYLRNRIESAFITGWIASQGLTPTKKT